MKTTLDAIKLQPIFHTWLLVPGELPDDKPYKQPFYASGGARSSTADAKDLAQLVPFAEAEVARIKQRKTGVGIALFPGCGMVAVDIDKVVKDGVIQPQAAQLCEGTYVEISPSGTGLRALFSGNLKSRKDTKAERGNFPLEVFGDSSYVTFTGNVTPECILFGLENTVASLTPAVLEEYAKRWGNVSNGTGVVAQSENDKYLISLGKKVGWTIENARPIVMALDAGTDRDSWLKVGMGLSFEFDGSEEAFELFDAWSATGANYAGTKDTAGRWRSFGRHHGGDPITAAWILRKYIDTAKNVECVISALKKQSRDDVLKTWVSKALPLSPPDVETLRDFVQQYTGTAKRPLNAALKAARDADRRDKKALATARRAGARQLIQHRPEDVTQQAGEVEDLIIKSAAPGEYVQFGGLLSQVGTKTPTWAHQADDIDAPAPPVLQIEPLNSVGILARVESVVVFVQGEEKTPCAVPQAVINTLRDKSEHAAPNITGVASHPMVMRDGSIHASDGIHQGTGLFFAGAAIGDTVAYSQPQASFALDRLRDAIGGGFEFATPLDAEIAVAALFTGIERRILDQAPGLAVMASSQASGKTTLARRIHALLTGRDMPATAFNDESDEAMVKRLISILLNNPAMVCFDNIKDGFTFRSAPVATAMTSSTFSDRVLGISKQATVPTNTLFVITGNNLSLGSDEVTRWLTCRLAPKAARPEKRTFLHPDVVAHALGIRNDVLRDAVGIIAGYREHAANSIPSGARFNQWDAMVRQPLMWAGGLDVAMVFDQNDESSEENSAHRGLLLCLHEKYSDLFSTEDHTSWFYANDVMELAKDHFYSDVSARLKSCLESLRVSNLNSARSIGHCLAAKKDKVAEIDGKALVLRGLPDRNGTTKYRVAGFAGF